MAKDNETVADIVTELRGYAHGFGDSMRLPMSFGTFRRYIDRIEKAARTWANGDAEVDFRTPTPEHETIADIIAEKRRRADEIERDCAEKMKRGEMVSDCYARELVADIRKETDRLEAAHKRERISPNGEAGAAQRSLEGCNCAKLREAAEFLYRIVHCAMVAGVVNRDDANKAMDDYHAALASTEQKGGAK